MKKLEKYLHTNISSLEEYKAFQNAYIRYLKTLCQECGWELCNIGRGHFYFSAFIKNQKGQFVYLSIRDVRFFPNQWYYHILIRRAEHERDYQGQMNHYAALPTLQVGIDCLFQGLWAHKQPKIYNQTF